MKNFLIELVKTQGPTFLMLVIPGGLLMYISCKLGDRFWNKAAEEDEEDFIDIDFGSATFVVYKDDQALIKALQARIADLENYEDRSPLIQVHKEKLAVAEAELEESRALAVERNMRIAELEAAARLAAEMDPDYGSDYQRVIDRLSGKSRDPRH